MRTKKMPDFLIRGAIVSGMSMILMSSTAFALSTFPAKVTAKYPSSTSMAQAKPNNCALCHTNGMSGAGAPKKNPYGFALEALGATIAIETRMATLESKDTDADGFTNLGEMTAGTLPGDKSSRVGIAAIDTWTAADPNTAFIKDTFFETIYNIAWTGKNFVVNGFNASARSNVLFFPGNYSSPDGITWTYRDYKGQASVHDMIWTGSELVGAGSRCDGGSSLAGVTWVRRQSNPPTSTSCNTNSFFWDGYQLIEYRAVGYNFANGTNQMFYAGTDHPLGTNPSHDSNTAINLYNPTTQAPDIVDNSSWNGSLFVQVGANGLIKTSPDGVTWVTRVSNVSVALKAVDWNGSIFIVVGDAGTVLTSADGIKWNALTTGITANLSLLESSGVSVIVGSTKAPGSFSGAEIFVGTLVNKFPIPSATAIVTQVDTSATSQVIPHDPDKADTHTYVVSTIPAHGTATIDSTGLTTYLPSVGYAGVDSFVVTVTDNGGLSADVLIDVTVGSTGTSKSGGGGGGGCMTSWSGNTGLPMLMLLLIGGIAVVRKRS